MYAAYLHARIFSISCTRSVYAMLWCNWRQPLCTQGATCACIPWNAPAKAILAMGSILTRASQAAPAFQDVIILHEPTSDQFFFVNFRLLERRCAQTQGPNGRGERHHCAEPLTWPTFLRLLEEPTPVGTELLRFSSSLFTHLRAVPGVCRWMPQYN